MKNILLFTLSLIFCFSCSKDSGQEPNKESQFTGKYFYAAKHHESGDYVALDLIVTISGINVKVEDDFASPSDLGPGLITGNTLLVKQHVDDGYDTRDITLTMTNNSGIMNFEYDVDFTEATGDYHIEGILTRQ